MRFVPTEPPERGRAEQADPIRKASHPILRMGPSQGLDPGYRRERLVAVAGSSSAAGSPGPRPAQDDFRASQIPTRPGHSTRAVSIDIRPSSARLRPGARRRFSASGLAPGDRVIWFVDGVPGGGRGLGTISPTGVYDAPVGPAPVDSVRIDARVKSSPRSSTAWVLLDGASRQRAGGSFTAVAPGCPRYVGGGLTMLECPIEARNQTLLEFGQRSHWIQPWRAYLDTVPASRLREAVGIQFNVAPSEADATARLLAASGVRRARVEIGWGEIDYDHPDRLWRPGPNRTILRALVRHGIRPLILLNSNQGIRRPSAISRWSPHRPPRRATGTSPSLPRPRRS